MKYNVHITFSAYPMGLKVEGLRGSLDLLDAHIAAVKAVCNFRVLPLFLPLTLSGTGHHGRNLGVAHKETHQGRPCPAHITLSRCFHTRLRSRAGESFWY